MCEGVDKGASRRAGKNDADYYHYEYSSTGSRVGGKFHSRNTSTETATTNKTARDRSTAVIVSFTRAASSCVCKWCRPLESA